MPTDVCSYHFCKVKTDLVECKHCGKFFCPEHLGPRLPYLPNFESTTKETRNAINNWMKPGGHPCPPYYDYLKEKEKEEFERRQKALDRMRGLRVRRTPEIPPVIQPGIRRRNLVAILAVIIILVAVGVIALFVYVATQPSPTPTATPTPPTSIPAENQELIGSKKGPKFEITDVKLSDNEVYVGQKLTEYIYVKNLGDEDGVYRLTVGEKSESIYIKAGATERMTFMWEFNEPGYYGRQVDNFTINFLVKEEGIILVDNAVLKKYSVPVKLIDNPNAKDPTYEELMDFLFADNTNNYRYDAPRFMCADFAEMLHNRAENAGIRAAFVAVDFEENYPGHALNAFFVTDKNSLILDCTGNIEGTGLDTKAEIEVGRQIVFESLKDPSLWVIKFTQQLIVKRVQVFWSGL